MELLEPIDDRDPIAKSKVDLQHALFYMSLDGKLHLAPIGDSPSNVLDIGTGTAIPLPLSNAKCKSQIDLKSS